MSIEEINESSTDVPAEPAEINSTSAPAEPAEIKPEAAAETTSKWGLNRRKFLTAAALGTAAATFLNKGSGGVLRLGPASALADVVTNVNCTANDVRISGPGIIINEPCTCTKTCTRSDGTTYACFDAQVKFNLINNTGTDRYCVTIHLCPGTSSSGVSFPAQDIVIGTVGPGPHEIIATIPNYPCGAGTVCFGAAGSGEDGGFAKGETCPTGQCCTVISWNVRPNDPCPLPHSDIIKSKCRAQQVCIQGRGITTLDCNTSLSGVQTNCAVPCGGTTTLQLCTTSDASLAPFTFSLTSSPATTISAPTGSANCRTYTVGPITQTTTFTGTVTDKDGCAKSATVTLTTTAVAARQLSGALDAGCTGSSTFTVANCDASVNYTYQEVDCVTGTPIGASQGGLGVCSATFTFAPGATDTTHCVRVTASNGSAACDQTAQASVVIPAAVTATLALQGTPGCDGVVTLLATAGGGVAPYTFQFNGATGTVSGSGNTRTIAIQPVLDGVCRSVTVTVTDSRGCSATSSAVSFSSCVTTTFNCA